MRKNQMTLTVLLLAASPASAYTLRYKVAKPDATAILVRLEAATGLAFAGRCDDVAKPECAIHGHLNTGPGYVVVELYQARTKDRRVAPVKVTADLKKLISQAVLNR